MPSVGKGNYRAFSTGEIFFLVIPLSCFRTAFFMPEAVRFKLKWDVVCRHQLEELQSQPCCSTPSPSPRVLEGHKGRAKRTCLHKQVPLFDSEVNAKTVADKGDFLGISLFWVWQ